MNNYCKLIETDIQSETVIADELMATLYTFPEGLVLVLWTKRQFTTERHCVPKEHLPI